MPPKASPAARFSSCSGAVVTKSRRDSDIHKVLICHKDVWVLRYRRNWIDCRIYDKIEHYICRRAPLTPPAPIPEHEFEAFLREHGCYGKKRAKEYAVYRKSDDRLVTTYAVKHGAKREVKFAYQANVLKALERIREEENSVVLDDQILAPNEESWKNQEWYLRQLQLESKCEQESNEENDDQ